MRTSARLGALVGATALSLALAACGSGADGTGSVPGADPSGSPSSSTASSSGPPAAAGARHNAADVTFARDMVLHHGGALDMARTAATRASTPQVKDLAARIEAAQGPEIAQMTGWLQAWGEPVTADGSTSGGGHSGGGHSGGGHSGAGHSGTGSGSTGPGSSTGMMTDEQMSQLRAATGVPFDRMFLEMMTTHHQDAIEMSRTEQASGSDPRVIALAKSIETSQAAEVAEMAQVLQGLA